MAASVALPVPPRSPRWWIRSQNRGRKYREAVEHGLKLIEMAQKPKAEPTKTKRAGKPAQAEPAKPKSEAAKHRERQKRNKRRLEQLQSYTDTAHALADAKKARDALKRPQGSMYVRGNLDWLKDQIAALAAEARQAGAIEQALKAYNALAILEGHVPGEGGIDPRTGRDNKIGVADLINALEAAERSDPGKVARLEQYRGEAG